MEVVLFDKSMGNVEEQLLDFAKALGLDWRRVQFAVHNRMFNFTVETLDGSALQRLIFNEVEDSYSGVQNGDRAKTWYWGDFDLSIYIDEMDGSVASRSAEICGVDGGSIRLMRIVPCSADVAVGETGVLSDPYPSFCQHKNVFFNDVMVQVSGDDRARMQGCLRFSGLRVIYS